MIRITLVIDPLDDDQDFSIMGELLETLEEFSSNYYFPMTRKIEYDPEDMQYGISTVVPNMIEDRVGEKAAFPYGPDDDYEDEIEFNPTEASVIAVS